MAETKTTKPKATKPKEEKPKVEEPEVGVTNTEANEAVTEQTETGEATETNTAVAVEPAPTGENAPEAEPGDVEEPTSEENPMAELDTAIDEAQKLNEELENKVAEVEQAEPEKVVEVAKKKLNELEELEDRVQREIEAESEKLENLNKRGAKSPFSRGFNEFWNGVSSGWEN